MSNHQENSTLPSKHTSKKSIGILTSIALLAGSACIATSAALPASAAATFPELDTAALVENDFVVFFANAGAAVTDSVAAGDHLGLYQSVSDQAYGVDAASGISWGYVASEFSVPTANNNSTNVKSGSVLYDARPSSVSVADFETRRIEYTFEIPDGSYDITFGYQLPSNWTSRTMEAYIEGEMVGIHEATSSTKEYEYAGISVTDGKLEITVKSEAGRTSTWTDPTLGWIEIRIPNQYTVENLAELIKLRTLSEEARAEYAEETVLQLDTVLAQARNLIDTNPTPAQVAQAYQDISQAWAGLRQLVTYQSFRPGEAWVDTDGVTIQAHGGQVVNASDGDYYWFGEDRVHGYQPMEGVHAYSSSDLYNWDNQGIALRTATSRTQMDEDPYFQDLYADYTELQKDIAYQDLDSLGEIYDHGQAVIFERPKVIYNKLTDQWIMWVHADGPTPTSSAQYAKASAGVAVADSPFGPYRYVDSYRLNYVSADDPDNKYPSQLGMARDMNLFVDQATEEGQADTGYIIYSSEENLTMYVSVLDQSYTFLDTYPDDAVKGKDFTNNWPGGQREAPAMFKYMDTYYLITSGATGWDPNAADYAVADNPLGPWTQQGNPATSTNGGTPSTTHSSQSTAVITVDAEAGKYIYMGDRWTPSDLGNSPYVWLPLDFSNEILQLPWLSEWTLEDLENRGYVSWDVDLPESITLGDLTSLPEQIEVNDSGESTAVDITWDSSALNTPGFVNLEGTFLWKGNSRTVSERVLVLPTGLTHVVDAGGDGNGADYLKIAQASGNLVTSVADQSYSADPQSGKPWGYLGDNTLTSSSDASNWAHSLRYVVSDSSDKTLNYRFSNLEPGSYSVYVGFYDPWSQWANNRRAKVEINGQTVAQSEPITGTETVGSYTTTVDDSGTIDLRLSPLGAGSGTDVQLSWIMIADPN